MLGAALYLNGQFERAAAACEMALALSGRHPLPMVALGFIYANCGKTADAEAIYAELLAQAAREYVQPTPLASLASALGKMDKALCHAREAFEIRDPALSIAKHFPTFARLREDPRFDEILIGMGLK